MRGEQRRTRRGTGRTQGGWPLRSRSANGVNGMAPTTTWTRVARRLGFDHNPLRRRLDVIEAWLLPAVITMFLAFGPLLVGGADAWAHARNPAGQQDQRSWHRVPAVLLPAMPGPRISD